MRHLIVLVTYIILFSNAFSQTPEKISYQAVIRDPQDNLVVDQSIGMQVSLLQGSTASTPVYIETHTANTNNNGLVSIHIGSGTVTSGDFSSIDWANGPYFFKVETDPTGGVDYSITMISQILSVPYALHSKTAETTTQSLANSEAIANEVARAIAEEETKAPKVNPVLVSPILGDASATSIAIGVPSAVASAVLDVNSTSQGFLPPRMTDVQRNQINTPIAGLMIWCTNCGPSGELQVFNGSNWLNLISGAGLSSDFIAPTITLIGNATINLTQDEPYVDQGATAIDNIDGDITTSIVVTQNVDITTPGQYTVTYNVTDAAGNPAVEVTRIVNVVSDVLLSRLELLINDGNEWKVSSGSVKQDGVAATEWDGFGIKFTGSGSSGAFVTTGRPATSEVPNVDVVWPASGTWEFADGAMPGTKNVSVLNRSDGLVAAISVSSTKLSITFTVENVSAGRLLGVAGTWVFEFPR